MRLLIAACLALSIAEEPSQPEPGPGAEAAKTAINTARRLATDGKRKQATDVLKAALKEAQRLDGSQEAQADLLSGLGEIYSESNKQAEMVGAFESSADLLVEKFGANDGRVSVAADRLAEAYRRSGEPVKALPLFRRLAKELKKNFGVGHVVYQQTLSKLGSAASAANKPKAAVKAWRELIKLLQQAPRQMQDGSELATVRRQLAKDLATSGALEAVLKEAELARSYYEEKFDELSSASGNAVSGASGGPSSGESGGDGSSKGPDAALEHAFAVNAVAGILEKLGRDDEAISTMESAYEMARASGRAEDDPLVMQGKSNLAGLKRHVERKRQRRQQQEPPPGGERTRNAAKPKGEL